MMAASFHPVNCDTANAAPQLKAKILIAEDSISQRKMLTALIEAFGHEVIECSDGYQAFELFKEYRPDLVILDIIMPVCDGINAAKHIREFLFGEYIPIIFLTGLDAEEKLDECHALGGDDIISKPFNHRLLSAKIASLLRVKKLYHDQVTQAKQLEHFRQLAQQDQEIAASIYKNFINAGFFETQALRYLLSPMALFNGDILLSARTPGNLLYVLLGDFTGHGLSAAMGAGPTAEIFYGMAQKGFSINEITVEINRKLMMIMPANFFLAATILALYPDSQTVKLINCGLPDHYLVNHETGEIITILSNNVPLGILSSYLPQEQVFQTSVQTYLYLFTDGIIEALGEGGDEFGTERIKACLSVKGPGFKQVLDAFHRFTQGQDQKDDLTLVELHCNSLNPIWAITQTERTSIDVVPLAWKTSLEFEPSALRKVNPVPIVMNSLMEIQGLKAHREALYVIVSELFTNALEHGLLGLDSSLKQTPDGSMRFYELREQQLQQLSEGKITISLSHLPVSQGGQLIIEVQDSGKGFDFNPEALNDNCMDTYYGRGMILLKKLCQSFEYIGSGNQVKATYEWTMLNTQHES